MKKIRLFALLVAILAISTYSQDILLVRSNGAKYKKMEIGVKTAVNNKNVNTIVFNNEAEITNIIQQSTPNVVVVMGADPIKAWKRIQQVDSTASQIPSVLVENNFYSINLGDTKNSCLISYEPKLKNYINNYVKLTGNALTEIGLIYSSRSHGLQKAYQNECAKHNVKLHAKSVVASELENSIKSIVENFIKHYKVDLIIVLDDYGLINDKNLSSIWVPALSSVKKQVAVPSDYFYDLEPKIGTFAIQPHYSEIGQTVASVINETETNGWKLRHKSVIIDKSVFYSRNDDGTISKENQIQNKVLASFFPEPEFKSEVAQVAIDSQKSTGDDKSQQVVAVKPTKVTKPIEQTVVIYDSSAVSNATSTKAEKPSSGTGSNAVAYSKNDVDKKIQTAVTLQKNVDSVKNTEMYLSDSELVTNKGYDIVVTSQTTSIYRDISPELHILGIGRDGDVLRVLSEDSLWYCVDFFGTQGFLSKESACSLSQKKDLVEHTDENQTVVIFVVMTLVAIVLILLLFMLTIRSVKRGKRRKTNCLMIRRKVKWIKYSSKNDKQVIFAKYLKNFGFKVRVIKDIDQIGILLSNSKPDIVFVDWQMEPGVHEKINEMLKEQILTEDCMVVFYNISDASEIGINQTFDKRTFFLSQKFTVLDLNKILLMVKMNSDEKNQRLMGMSDSSLNGVITEQSLLEIVHMMDVNKKTGCLLVKDQTPIGMIFFEEGLMTYAMTNTKVAEQAVFEILSLKSGHFQFLPGRKPASRQMELNIMSVLMEYAKAEDESSESPSIFVG